MRRKFNIYAKLHRVLRVCLFFVTRKNCFDKIIFAFKLVQKYLTMLRMRLVKSHNVFLIPKGSQNFIFPHHRLITVKVPKTATPTLPNLEDKDSPTPKGKLKSRLFQRFFDYISGYESVLKKVLPASAVRIFELFSKGTKSLFADMKDFAGTNHVLTATTNWEKACKTLTRHQLEVRI